MTSSSSLPTEQWGLLSTPASISLQKFPFPKPGPGEVTVRNVAVASNPKDWKYPGRTKGYSGIEGNDVAGTIAVVGEGVTEYKVGDRVGAYSRMATQDFRYGAYAEYTVAPAKTTFPLGKNTTYEAASTLPLAVMTAAIGLFVRLAIPEPPPSGFAPSNGKAIIVNGASSSVGAFAVQLAKRAGYFVIGVAGRSKQYAKDVGADIVIDYREEKDLESALVAAVGNWPLVHAYDAVTLDGSAVMLARVISKTSPNGKGKVTFVLFMNDEERTLLPAGVDAERTAVATAYGEDIEFAAKYYRLISEWVDEGSFQPNRVRIVPNGLGGVEGGLKELKDNQVHAEKLVYLIADTPEVKQRASL